jgi:hypothetical protein
MAATTAATRAPGAGGFTAVELEMFAGAGACALRSTVRTPRAHACLCLSVSLYPALTLPPRPARARPACCVKEDQMVQIVPHFTFQDVHFLSGCYGPFQVMG